MALISAGSFYYRIQQEQTGQKTINSLKAEIVVIEEDKEKLKNKILEIKKYRKVFQSISNEKRNSDGIDFDNINSKLKIFGELHNIYNPEIKVSFPENLKNGIFKMRTIAMVSSSVTLSFIAINDIEALLFISEFVDSLPGYTVIHDMSIKKTRIKFLITKFSFRCTLRSKN